MTIDPTAPYSAPRPIPVPITLSAWHAFLNKADAPVCPHGLNSACSACDPPRPTHHEQGDAHDARR